MTQQQTQTISIVVPCYNEEKSIPLFYAEIKHLYAQLSNYAFELIFIDDGSKDASLAIIKKIKQTDTSVKYISFSRNFGKEAALYAGLELASGEYVATLDVDLQDPPSLLPEMIDCLIRDDFDCAATRRVTRKGEPAIRSFFARQFYKIMNIISDAQIVDGARDFRLMKRSMVNAVLSLKERNRFSKGIFSWVGFKTKWFEYKNIERTAGETKWSFWKLFLYSLDGIVAFSTFPLFLASILGIICFFASLIVIGIFVVKTLIFGDPVAGYPSLISIVLFLGGIQLLSIGIVGQYLAKTYIETKNRPLFIIKEKE